LAWSLFDLQAFLFLIFFFLFITIPSIRIVVIFELVVIEHVAFLVIREDFPVLVRNTAITVEPVRTALTEEKQMSSPALSIGILCENLLHSLSLDKLAVDYVFPAFTELFFEVCSILFDLLYHLPVLL
jgi:hypothetical protein